MTTDDRIVRLRTECDNYNRALEALKGLTHELLWDSTNKSCVLGGIAHFGRRMHSSAANRISPSRKITPDMVAQRTIVTGTIVEVKASMPENDVYRRQTLAEVQKYDDDLTGWVTPTTKMPSHDLVLLVDYPNSQVVKGDIESLTGSGEFSCKRPFALVYFSHQQRADATWVALHLIYGAVSDPSKQQILQKICMIHPENIAANPLFGQVLLYDARPPLPLLMIRLYEAINSNLSEDEYLRLRTEGQLTKTLSLAAMKELLADYCCPEQSDSRVPKLPETAWIKSALKMWEEMGWVIKSPDVRGSYDVIIKKTRREPFEQFLKVCAEAEVKHDQKKEKELLRLKKADEKFRQDHPLLAFAAEEGSVNGKGGQSASPDGMPSDEKDPNIGRE